MKLYKITDITAYNSGFACLRPSNTQSVRKVKELDVWWDSFYSGGKKIGDFVGCVGIKVAKISVFETLQKHFKSLEGVPLRINKTQQELKAKNPKRLRWLPQEEIPLTAFYSPVYFDCLPESTIVRSERGIEELIGVADFKGDILTPREEGKGLFFSAEAIESYDFFTLTNSNLLLCTERVKTFCETQGYGNVVFLEMGEVV
ncbi:hypothetical protein RCZ04_15630 [Capnocytophaga sp. HP1101]